MARTPYEPGHRSARSASAAGHWKPRGIWLVTHVMVPVLAGVLSVFGAASVIHLRINQATAGVTSGDVNSSARGHARQQAPVAQVHSRGQARVQQNGRDGVQANQQKKGRHNVQQNGNGDIVSIGGDPAPGGPGGTGGTGGRGGNGGVVVVPPQPGGSRQSHHSGPKCTGYPASVSAPEQTGPTFLATMTVTCPPARGQAYFLIAQLDNVPPHGTTNYYPKVMLPSASGTYTYQFNVEMTPVGISRDLFIVSADSQQAAELQNAPATGIVNNLPEGTQVVSPVVTSTRTS